MKYFYVPAALLMAVALFSCQKETNEDLPDPPEVINKIKTYTEDLTSAAAGHTVETFNLFYDDLNRLASVQSTTNGGNKLVFGYPDEHSSTTDIYSNGAIVIHENEHINDDKLVDSIFQYNNEGDTTIQNNIFNDAGQLIRTDTYDKLGENPAIWSSTFYTYGSNGNLVTETEDNTTTTYSYDEVILNTVTIGPMYMFVPKQLPTKEEYTNGTTTYSLTHTFSFDEQKRVIQDKAVGSDGDVLIKTYTYY